MRQSRRYDRTVAADGGATFSTSSQAATNSDHKHGTDKKILKAIRELLPKVSLSDFREIEAIANRPHLRHLPASVIAWQATTTHIRHNHTEYDELLAEGYDPESARHFVVEPMNDILAHWGCTRQLDVEAE